MGGVEDQTREQQQALVDASKVADAIDLADKVRIEHQHKMADDIIGADPIGVPGLDAGDVPQVDVNAPAPDLDHFGREAKNPQQVRQWQMAQQQLLGDQGGGMGGGFQAMTRSPSAQQGIGGGGMGGSSDMILQLILAELKVHTIILQAIMNAPASSGGGWS